MSLYLLIVVPLFAAVPNLFMNQSGTPKMLSAALGLYMLLAPGIRPKAMASRQVVTFFVVCLISWLFAANRWIGFAGCPGAQYYGIFQVAMVVLAYLGSSTIKKDPVPLLAWAGAALGAFAVAQIFFGQSLTWIPLQGGRASGFRGSPVMLGASLIPCFLASWHRARERFSDKSPFSLLLPIVLTLCGMFAAGAKGAVVASIAAVWAYETVGGWRWSGIAAGLLGLWASLVVLPIKNNEERRELIRVAWLAFRVRPWLGWGPDNFIMAMGKVRTEKLDQLIGSGVFHSASHQDLSQVAATLGLAGLWAYLTMLKALIKSSLEDPLALAVIVGMVFQVQVNTVPPDVLIIAAVLVGSRTWSSKESVEIPDWVRSALIAWAIALAAVDLTPWIQAVRP